MHRGSKEMDLLLGNFVKKNIDKLNNNELEDLEKLLFIEDEIIYNKFCSMMTNKEILKKQIIYRSMHRGTKEMDLLLGNFVKKHINKLNVTELKDLAKLLFIEDEVIYKWYFEKNSDKLIPKTKVTIMLKNFKL